MARGRPSLPIGQHGEIATSKAGGVVTARCRYRDADGITRQVTARGTSAPKARAALLEKLGQRSQIGGQDITVDSTVAQLAEAWFATVDESPATRDAYRYTLDKDILPGVGGLRMREATTARLDGFLRSCHSRGHSVAKRARVALSLMFGMAARYDAVPANPVAATKLPKAERKEVKALSVDQLAELRADIAAWAAQRPARAVLNDVVDLFLATGLRPGELLAVRFEDVDLRGRTLEVTGTIKRDSVNGLHRQPAPKTVNGARILPLPDFAVSMLRRRQLAAGGALVFPNRKGGPLEPANFRRTWREARGDKWADVEPRALRRAVATIIERENGALAAASQLGHGSDAVTRKHYIERNRLAQDNSAALDQLRKAE